MEATTALARASGIVRLAVQLKREIGKLWEDIAKAPYCELFNPSVPGLHVGRCVQIQRKIDRALENCARRMNSYNNYGLTTHGNRIIATLVFDALPVTRFKEPAFDAFAAITDDAIFTFVDDRVRILGDLLEKHYPNSIIPTLFKNLRKCEHLATEARNVLASTELASFEVINVFPPQTL